MTRLVMAALAGMLGYGLGMAIAIADGDPSAADEMGRYVGAVFAMFGIMAGGAQANVLEVERQDNIDHGRDADHGLTGPVYGCGVWVIWLALLGLGCLLMTPGPS